MTVSTEDIDKAVGDHSNPDDKDRTPDDWAKLRQETKARKDAEAAKAESDRKLAFYQAGINPADKDAPPHTQMFIDAYKGELTPDAIKAEAVKMNILKPEAPPEASPEAQAAAAAGKQIDGASEGAPPTNDSTSIATIDEAFNSKGVKGVSEELAKLGIPTVEGR